MVMGEIDRRHLVNSTRARLIHLEALDGYVAPRIFSVAHVCKPSMETDLPNVQELLSKDVRGGDDPTCSAYLGEKP